MNQFGTFLKTHIHHKQLSVRQLSYKTDIDKGTISRIMNGKRNPTMTHLSKLSEALHIPYLELLQQAGHPVPNKMHSDNISDLQIEIGALEQTLLSSKQARELFSMKKLHRILKDLRMYAATEKGEQFIQREFESKLVTLQGRGPFIDQLKKCFTIFTKKQASTTHLILIGSALLYFIVPIDVIPDYLFPIGFIDDAIACQLVLNSSGNKGGLSN